MFTPDVVKKWSVVAIGTALVVIAGTCAVSPALNGADEKKRAAQAKPAPAEPTKGEAKPVPAQPAATDPTKAGGAVKAPEDPLEAIEKARDDAVATVNKAAEDAKKRASQTEAKKKTGAEEQRLRIVRQGALGTGVAEGVKEGLQDALLSDDELAKLQKERAKEATMKFFRSGGN